MVRQKNANDRMLVVVGPTASGKSALAVQLAKKFNGEVISADSRQVYRGLDIGTGKITIREMRGIRHHLLDIASPRRTVSAHDFVVRAENAIRDIASRNKLPIVCGGTGFYIDALLGRVTLSETPPNAPLRTRLAGKTPAELFALLARKDPVRARRMNTSDTQNPRRLVRALEIALAKTKNRLSYTKSSPSYEVLWLGITWPKKKLEHRIRTRLNARLRLGMVAEARRLHSKGLSYKHMGQFGLEYRSLARFLQGKISRKEMLAEMERDINRYAKRQTTYWKRNKNIRWFLPRATARILHATRAFLSR